MADDSFFVAGLQRGNIVMLDQFNSPVPFRIEIVSGSVAGRGTTHIIKGRIQSPDAPANLSRLVALKVILSSNPGAAQRERIRRELAAVEVARHRHILPFVGAGTVSGCTILVSGFMKNGDMLGYIKADRSARKEQLIHQISDAVNHLHTLLSLVHGDLKCQNVLIADNGDALLADFGLTTTVGGSSAQDLTTTTIRTSNTLRFAAPELLSDTAKSPLGKIKSKTTQSDVYAFGMLIIQAFTETRPWPALTDGEVRLKLASKEAHPRPDKSLEIGLTDFWWDLCQTCSKFKPEERPTMGEIYSKLTATVASKQVDSLTFKQITPSYGRIGEDELGYRDANTWLLNAVQGPEKALEQLPPAKRSWIAVVNAFAQCPLLIPSRTFAGDATNSLEIERSAWWKRDKVYKSVEHDLRTFLSRIWNDYDIEHGPGEISRKAICDIVAHAGTLLAGDPSYKKEHQTRNVVDIGVLRYPDINARISRSIGSSSRPGTIPR